MKYLFILFFSPLHLFSQGISGIWTGTLFNDTTKQTIDYEIAINQSKGKYTAYSHTTFVLGGKKIVGVKSLKVDKESDVYFFEDDDLLFNNYPTPPPKGVKQISKLTISKQGDSILLTGIFTTTRTRQYGRQVTGKVFLVRKNVIENSKLMAALDGLGLAKNLHFLSQINNVKVSIIGNEEKDTEPVIAPIKKITTDPLTELAKRKIETIETVEFTSDSLQLVLYDNGYVDGDSVSLIVNGEVLLQHQLLSTRAITKTLQTPTGVVDSLNIIMFAENLGSIAPNSGLLIILDGDKRHEITFSGDLQKNAAIVLKRKN
jgi:hypothetical protein